MDGQFRYDVTNRFSQFYEHSYKDGAVISLYAIEEPGIETNLRKLYTTANLEIGLRGL
jgi:hypothetical protein